MALTPEPSRNILSLPLEVQHNIFSKIAERDETQVPTRKHIRRWFEKKDVKEQVASYVAENPNEPAPTISYEQLHRYEMQSDSESEDEEHEDHDSEDSDSEEDEWDEDHVQNEDNDELEDADEPGNEAEGGQDQDEIVDEEEPLEAASTTAVHTAEGKTTTQHGAEQTDEGSAEAETADNMDIDEVDNAPIDDELNDENSSRSESEGEDNEQALSANNASAPVPAPPAIIMRPSSKWRHISNLIQVTRSPPPSETFLICKELTARAKDWYYDAAIIKIDATAGFAHNTFFELALDETVDAAFSPFESIRKVRVKLVWDTAWIRDQEEWVDDIFSSFLRERATFVLGTLRKAPELKECVLEWHDSINDAMSEDLKHEVLSGFLELPAQIQMEDHYLKEGEIPHAKSAIGRKRIEFQQIMDGGMQLY